jgi:hypothetical protein
MNPNHQMRRSDPLPACVAAGVVQCISRYEASAALFNSNLVSVAKKSNF